MIIYEVKANKRNYMDLLLLADEQESMIEMYLDRGTMFVLEEGGIRAQCVVTEEGSGVLEVKSLSVVPDFQRRGYGRALLHFLEERYAGQALILQVGTGDSPATVPFYEACGFQRSHIISNFFTEHYDHPIYEAGVRLEDMIYLRKNL